VPKQAFLAVLAFVGKKGVFSLFFSFFVEFSKVTFSNEASQKLFVFLVTSAFRPRDTSAPAIDPKMNLSRGRKVLSRGR
jgi:hypothetical protein